jgi:ribosome biogenesis protein Nip4
VETLKAIKDFVAQFRASVPLDESLMVKKKNRYYLLSERLMKQTQQDFFYAGVYLGKLRGRIFFPSFLLLTMMAEGKGNKIVVDKKTAWLFICGRDIFKQGILELKGTKRKGHYTLVLNEHNECLGFGKIARNILIETDANEVVVKNILDIGDFLRREKRQSRQW